MTSPNTSTLEEPTEQKDTSEELRWNYAGGDSDLVGERLNSRDMRRRLPVLVRRSFSMAWKIDRRSTAALVGCQITSGLLSALGLFATTRALGSVIAAASDPSRLRGALPAVFILAGAAGLRSLLGTAIQSLSQRLQPRIARDAGHQLLIAGLRGQLRLLGTEFVPRSSVWPMVTNYFYAATEPLGAGELLDLIALSPEHDGSRLVHPDRVHDLIGPRTRGVIAAMVAAWASGGTTTPIHPRRTLKDER